MKTKISVIVFSLLVAACAHAPGQVQGGQTVGNAGDEKSLLAAQSANEEVYPKVELSSQMLYTFLLADIAAQRNRTDLAAQEYLELAKATRDLRVVRRAAQLAYESHQMERTLEAFKLWHDLEPAALMPKQMLATVLLGGGKPEQARPYLVELLAADPANAGRNFIQIYPLLARNADKTAVYKMLQELARPYLNMAEIHWVLAQAAGSAGQPVAALSEARQARAINPEWEMPVLLEAQLLSAGSPAQALALAKGYLSTHPDANEVHLFYARALLEQKQYPESRNQFQQLLAKQPGNADLAFAIALLSIQMGELDRAEAELKQSLAAGKKDSSTVHYYLGQLNEAKKNNEDAMGEYKQVMEGEYVFPSRLRIAYLLVKANNMTAAREVLHQTVARNNQQRALVILTEGQLLRDVNKYDEAFSVLKKGLKILPNHPDLLYEAAMVADKQGKGEVSEDLLRKLIKVAPDNAHAYNALGYSMLVRNIRLGEAMQFIEKAYQLAPDDAAILDSVGWGHYLLGNLAKSLEFMRRAYAAMPEPEIAAHLGEVLWKMGTRDEAQNIWQDTLKKNPDSAVLKAVIKKHLP